MFLDLRVMEMMDYSTLRRSPEMESYHRMQSSVLTTYFWQLGLSSARESVNVFEVPFSEDGHIMVIYA